MKSDSAYEAEIAGLRDSLAAVEAERDAASLHARTLNRLLGGAEGEVNELRDIISSARAAPDAVEAAMLAWWPGTWPNKNQLVNADKARNRMQAALTAAGIHVSAERERAEKAEAELNIQRDRVKTVYENLTGERKKVSELRRNVFSMQTRSWLDGKGAVIRAAADFGIDTALYDLMTNLTAPAEFAAPVEKVAVTKDMMDRAVMAWHGSEDRHTYEPDRWQRALEAAFHGTCSSDAAQVGGESKPCTA
jgi:hypothetical protein